MDRLTIFPATITNVSLSNNSLDNVVEGLDDIERELKLTRKGHEEWTWGEEVEDSEIDLEGIEL